MSRVLFNEIETSKVNGEDVAYCLLLVEDPEQDAQGNILCANTSDSRLRKYNTRVAPGDVFFETRRVPSKRWSAIARSARMPYASMLTSPRQEFGTVLTNHGVLQFPIRSLDFKEGKLYLPGKLDYCGDFNRDLAKKNLPLVEMADKMARKAQEKLRMFDIFNS